MVIFSPVIADEQHQPSRDIAPETDWQRRGDSQRSNGQVLTRQAWGTSSHQRLRLLTTSGRTVCRKASKGLKSGVLTRRPLPEPSLPNPPGRSH